ncbi:hypothetical protein [Sphingomonas sp. CLY1604]|uniref:hypothetical protein n=1 Tax=Sphingomonas sp. CLY1604 TaxID=3457786 RepID=UPI003FD8B042
MNRSPLQGSVVPFARRWHVIDEIDLVRLAGEHRRRVDLCAQAEAIADALPRWPDADIVSPFLAALNGIAAREGDECALLDAMLLHGHDDPLAETLLQHIRQRHAADGECARELVAALAEGDDRPCSETLGYMLRGFFSSCRRAIDFEQVTILALAGHRLTQDARALIVDALADGLYA